MDNNDIVIENISYTHNVDTESILRFLKGINCKDVLFPRHTNVEVSNTAGE